MHSTRLFPKGNGASQYRLTGIASRCDWAVLTDCKDGEVSLRGDFSKQPRTVYLSLRSFHRAIPYFFDEILPIISGKFVLITGSEDITIPNQIDARWREFNVAEKEQISKIIKDERLIHWFAENRDELLPKMSTIPVGYVFTGGESNTIHIDTSKTLIKDRPLKVLCAHRVREGKQWELRRNLNNLCNERYQEIATVITEEVSELAFQQQLRQHPFRFVRSGRWSRPFA